MSFTPYIMFSGDCAEAFTRYQEIFGGELVLLKNSEVPDGGMPGADPDAIMHAAIKVDGQALLMASDDPSGDDGPKGGVLVAYTAPDVEQSRSIFDGLAEGGEVDMPFAPTFWSPGFGSCTDRFGVPWFIDTEGEPSPQG